MVSMACHSYLSIPYSTLLLSRCGDARLFHKPPLTLAPCNHTRICNRVAWLNMVVIGADGFGPIPGHAADRDRVRGWRGEKFWEFFGATLCKLTPFRRITSGGSHRPPDGFCADLEQASDLLDLALFHISHSEHLSLLGRREGRGLPPTRPRFRAASSPSFVRSTIRSRSNWAIDAKM